MLRDSPRLSHLIFSFIFCSFLDRDTFGNCDWHPFWLVRVHGRDNIKLFGKTFRDIGI